MEIMTYPILVYHGGESNRHGPGSDTQVCESQVTDELVTAIVERSVAEESGEDQGVA